MGKRKWPFIKSAPSGQFVFNRINFQKMKHLQNKRWVFAGAVFNTLIMIMLTLVMLASAFSFGDDVVLIQLTSGFKNLLLKTEDKPKRDEFFFVSVSWEKQLIEKLDSSGFPIGTDVITNRESLGRLLQKMNSAPDNHRFMLMDVYFDTPSPTDSLLEAELKRTKNLLLSYHKHPDGKPAPPIFEAPLGLSDMVTDNDMVMKYHLVQGDSLKTSAILMYEQLYGKELIESRLYDKLGEEYVFNTFIIDQRLRSFDLFKASDSLRYPMMYISELLTLPDEMLHELLKNRIVVIGDFEGTDTHKTIYGDTPGPLILVNAFLALERGDNVISPFFLLLLVVSYFLISFKAVRLDDHLTRYVNRKFANFTLAGEFLVDTTFYVVYLAVVSITSYFLFGVHLTVLLLAFYLYGLEQALRFVYEKIYGEEAVRALTDPAVKDELV